MILTSSVKALLHLISIVILTSSASAYAITEANLSESFRLHRGNGKGGCDRISPNGTPMQQKVITDLNDAFSLAEVALAQIPKATSLDGARIRELFKLFFGVSFDSKNFQVNASDGSQVTYNGVKCEQKIPTQTFVAKCILL